MIVFTHRGLAPHQFTPMSGAHKVTAANVRPAFPFRGLGDFERGLCAPPFRPAHVAELGSFDRVMMGCGGERDRRE